MPVLDTRENERAVERGVAIEDGLPAAVFHSLFGVGFTVDFIAASSGSIALVAMRIT